MNDRFHFDEIERAFLSGLFSVGVKEVRRCDGPRVFDPVVAMRLNLDGEPVVDVPWDHPLLERYRACRATLWRNHGAAMLYGGSLDFRPDAERLGRQLGDEVVSSSLKVAP